MSKIIEIRPAKSKSWLDGSYSHVLASQLSDRLVNRCSGQNGLFVTLTYRRNEYEQPVDLYRSARDNRHVRRFVELVGKYINESLSGRWICKLEFQAGGWVHYHLIVLGISHIEHSALQSIWGHGFVWVNRLTPKRIRYACKYLSKGESLPKFLYSEPVRSVKIIRTSPGFWNETPKSGGGKEPPEEPASSKLSGCYVPIGSSIEMQEQCTIIRNPDGTQYEKRNEPCWQVAFNMIANGSQLLGTVDGWIQISVPSCQTRQIRHAADSTLSEAMGGRRAALHLINNRKPPNRHRWLDQYFEEKFKCPNLIPSVGGV